MAILDFLPGRKGRRTAATRLLEAIDAPIGRLHAAIRESGTAQAGPDFEALWQRFADCRLYRPDELASLPAKDLDTLDRFVAGQIAAARPLLAEVGAALALVRRDWRRDDLVAAAAGGGLRALGQLDELAQANTAGDRLLRTVALVEIDMACADVRGELTHIAQAPSLFW